MRTRSAALFRGVEGVMRKATAEQKWLKRLERAGEVLAGVQEGYGAKAVAGATILEIRLLLRSPDRGDCLLIVKASSPEGRHVAFCGGPDPVTALLTWRAKEEGAGIKYREDRPWKE